MRRSESYVIFILCWRYLVRFARKNLTDTAAVGANLPKRIYYDAVLYENKIAVFSHQFAYQCLRYYSPAGTYYINVERYYAVETVLAYLGDTACFNLLPENHAEGRGLCRAFKRRIQTVKNRVLRLY